MGAQDSTPRTFSNLFADAVGPAGVVPDRDRCRCVGHSVATRPTSVDFHGDRQDTTAPGWLRLLDLIEEAAADRRAEFKPFVQLSAAERRQVVTLPAQIGRLTEVRRLVLYGTNLVRLPPEIGAMTNLESFHPYTSHRLHWYPYELSRCGGIADSTVSTRVLYGNFKFRPPFPSLRPVTRAGDADLTALDPAVWGAEAVRSCSVCDGTVDRELHQVWISRAVGTDVLPLLVNACSQECVAALPDPYPGYLPPHTGGAAILQPAPGW